MIWFFVSEYKFENRNSLKFLKKNTRKVPKEKISVTRAYIYIPEKENISYKSIYTFLKNIRYIHSGKLYIYICHKSIYQIINLPQKHTYGYLPYERAEDIMERKMLWQPHEQEQVDHSSFSLSRSLPVISYYELQSYQENC